MKFAMLVSVPLLCIALILGFSLFFWTIMSIVNESGNLYLRIDPASHEPLYLQVKKIVKNRILSGQFSQGKRLPSMRELAEINFVSRITIEKAYWQLEREGVLMRKRGDGYFVHLGPHMMLRNETMG